MGSGENSDRDIGRLSEAVRLLQQVVEEQGTKIDAISATLSEARGGWKALMLFGGGAAGTGIAIGAWFQHLLGLADRVSK